LKKQFSRQSSELVKQFRRIVASAAQRLTYGNHALNSGSLEALRAQETKRVVKVPYGIDSQAYRVSDKQERFTATFLGRLTYQKGIDLLPRLVSKLAGKAPDIRLQIAGYGELSGLVSNLANANPELEYVGLVWGQKKRRFLSGSHVYFSLSRGEAFMLTGLEAMASGTPVITFDIDGPREYVKDGYNGYLCGNLDDFAQRILSVWKMWKHGDESYWQICKNARLTAEAFDWSNIVPQLEKMLHYFADTMPPNHEHRCAEPSETLFRAQSHS
jgi:glycosyltransferase involved in cell wall biosynthesis